MHYLDESHIFLFLVQVAILLGLARALGLFLQRFGQPAVTAEILVGILLGPTLLGRFAPEIYQTIFPDNATQQNMLETVAWLGILFFLLLTGLETDFGSAWRQRKQASIIAISDLIIPMVIAFIPSLLLPESYLAASGNRLLFALFIATIMTISALPVTARALQELNIYKTDPGLLIMCALTINDLAGWLVFAMILGFVTGGGFQLSQIGVIVIGTILFALISLTIIKRLVDRGIRFIHRHELPEPGTSLTFICIIGMLGGAITLKLGIHALFGFFIAGIVAGESRALPERTRHVISEMVRSLLVPLFFATIGLKVDFAKNFDWFLVVLILVLGVAGRFIGAWIGTTLSREAKSNRMIVSIAHTPGGEMQIVVGLLALEYGVITPTVYVAIIFGALASSIILGPWLRWALNRAKVPPLLSFLSPDNIEPALQSDNRQGAIAELCRLASRKHKDVGSAESLSQQVIQREQLQGTALEEGIALPHLRIDSLDRPLVTVGRSETGIDWDSADGKPAQLIFLVLTPTDRDDAQLRIYRGIATAMDNDEKRSALLKSHTRESFWTSLETAFASDRKLGTAAG